MKTTITWEIDIDVEYEVDPGQDEKTGADPQPGFDPEIKVISWKLSDNAYNQNAVKRDLEREMNANFLEYCGN